MRTLRTGQPASGILWDDHMLARGAKMARRRYRASKIEQREHGTFYRRPWLDIIQKDGTPGWAKRVIDLENCQTRREAQKLAA
jgi:hypothetical protein